MDKNTFTGGFPNNFSDLYSLAIYIDPLFQFILKEIFCKSRYPFQTLTVMVILRCGAGCRGVECHLGHDDGGNESHEPRGQGHPQS